MSDQLTLLDEEYSPELSQWYSRPALAEKVVKWALKGVMKPIRILEPSAGTGALIRPVPVKHHITAIEIDPRRCEQLREISHLDEVRCYDYLQRWTDERWDLAIMNSPYEDDQDVLHAIKAATSDADRVVAVMKLPTLQGINKWALWMKVEVTRIAICVARQPFDGPKKDSPRDGTMIVELVAREHLGQLDTPYPTQLEWWG